MFEIAGGIILAVLFFVPVLARFTDEGREFIFEVVKLVFGLGVIAFVLVRLF